MRTSELFIFLFFSLLSVSIFAESEVCFKKEIPVFCEEELKELNSLNGSFHFENQYYEFSARRAYSKDWCKSTQLKIQKIMRIGEFCMKFEEQLSERDLTVDSVKGLKVSWSYFQ